MIKIITDRKEWNSLLDKIDHYDYYHTYDYHQITKENGDKPVMIHYSEGNINIALPLLIRKIWDTPYNDATSVYGYAGPLTQNIEPAFDNSEFKQQLHSYLRDNNIISIFSRLHPFLPTQRFVLKNIGDITPMGKIVNIDLTKDLDKQRQAYQKRLKTYVNKARNEYSVAKAKTKSEILKFIELYYDNMRRVDASPGYFFKHDYFFDLMASEDFKAEVLMARVKGSQEIIGGAMFIKKNNIVQYHLSGANEEYLHLNPIKLLIDEARISATEENFTFLNLGGGIGSKEDSLFHFKAGFSKDHRVFSIWKFIVNNEIYDNLVQERLKDIPQNLHNDLGSYFPRYRCNI